MEDQKAEFRRKRDKMEQLHNRDQKEVAKLKEKLRGDHEFFRMEMQRKDQVQGKLREQFSSCVSETVSKLTAYLRQGQNEHRSKLLDVVADLKT